MIRPRLLKNFISSYVKTAFTECLCDNLAHRLRRTMTKTVKEFEEPQCAERSVISLRLESVADSLH